MQYFSKYRTSGYISGSIQGNISPSENWVTVQSFLKILCQHKHHQKHLFSARLFFPCSTFYSFCISWLCGARAKDLEVHLHAERQEKPCVHILRTQSCFLCQCCRHHPKTCITIGKNVPFSRSSGVPCWWPLRAWTQKMCDTKMKQKAKLKEWMPVAVQGAHEKRENMILKLLIGGYR